jgi:two-component system chemotaxis sensor kinase CheA
MNSSALTNAALDNLERDALPRVMQLISELRDGQGCDPSRLEQLRSLMRETTEIIHLFLDWTPTLIPQNTNTGPHTALIAVPPLHHETMPSKEDVQLSISDDEALRLLAEMDAPLDMNSANQAAEETTAPDNHTETQTETAEAAPEWEANDFASDPEMMKDFTTNSAELVQALDESILKLEQSPTDRDIIEEIFRSAHTLKGAAGMFGFRAIERLMHRMENLFDHVRKGKLIPNSQTIDAVFNGLDCLKKLLPAAVRKEPSGINIENVIRLLQSAADGKFDTKAAQNIPKADVKPLIKSNGQESTSTHSATSVQAQTSSQRKTETPGETIRVDLEKLDTLVNLIGELVIDKTRFQALTDAVRHENKNSKLASTMAEALQMFTRHMADVQDITMKIRMVPVGSVFNKYPRIVRDLARQLDKDIELIIEGEDTEFDKTLVEQIGDPLVHLIRNACDHGIETRELRVKSNKNQVGKVHLSAKQEGNQILIKIQDDGKGMDTAKIRAKALEKGLIKPDQQMTDHEVFNLIFEPGFSTAETVTTVSGRGVGMDVVKKQISKLKGTVDISSALGFGSIITIRLPLTLAIIQILLVESQGETFGIPLNSVVESIRINVNDIEKVAGSEMIQLRDKALPVYHLDKILSLSERDQDLWYRAKSNQIVNLDRPVGITRREQRRFLVVIDNGDKRFGIIADSLQSQQELVIKPLGHLLPNIPCIAGGAILGHGDVILVLDPTEIEPFLRRMPTRQIAA